MKHTVTEVKLKSGARGLLIDVPGATVMSCQFHFRAGNRFTKSKDIYETAHIMEHMAFGANAQFKNEHDYEAEFSKNGAYHNAYTSDNSMVYISDCADFEWDRIMRLNQVSITEPRFNSRELKSESGNVKSELTGYLNNHNRVLWPRIQQALGEDVLTFRQRLQTIGNVKLRDIQEHYDRTHTSDNLRFVVAGKLYRRKKQLLQMLEQWDLKRGERLVIPEDAIHGSDKPVLIKRKEASNLTFGLSLNIPRRLSEKEITAMGCVDHILTGTLYSRIYGAARRKGLVYGIFSDTSMYEYSSAWDFGAQVNVETVEPLIDIVAKELKNVLDGKITKKEIERAKQSALGRHQMGAQTVGEINHWYANRYFFDEGVRDYDTQPRVAIEAVTKSQIIEVAREFAHQNCWIVGGIGNVEKELMERLNDKISTVLDSR